MVDELLRPAARRRKGAERPRKISVNYRLRDDAGRAGQPGPKARCKDPIIVAHLCRQVVVGNQWNAPVRIENLLSVNALTKFSSTRRDDPLGGHPTQEALMRRGVNITVALILIALLIKIMGVPSGTVAGTDVTIGPTLPIYNLHAAYPHVNDLPVQEAPQP